MAKEEIVQREAPVDSAVLADLEYYVDRLKMLAESCEKIGIRLSATCDGFDYRDAQQLDAAIEQQNLRKETLAVANYGAMIRMLTQNIESDIRSILNKRKEFQRQELMRLARLQAETAKEHKRKIERERYAAEKADAEKE